MFTTLTLSLVLGAPVPAPTAPVPTGVAPRLMELKADANGKITVVVTRIEKIPVAAGAAIAPANGGAAPPAVLNREVSVSRMVELSEVKDLTITTADGKKVTTEDGLKKIVGGAIVVVSGDGKAVSPTFLKVFKDDTLVLVSPELTGAQNTSFKPFPGGIRPQPLPPIQIQPGVIQVLPVQGGIQIEVAPPAPVPVQKAPVEK